MKVIAFDLFGTVFDLSESDPIRAAVKQVCLNGENVDYEVVYWSGTTRTAVWLSSREVRPVDETKFQPIGFRGTQ